MGKITPRFFLAVFICGLLLLSANTALSNINYGPERPVAKKQAEKQSFFVGFYLDAAPTITAPDDKTNIENNPGECYANSFDLGEPNTTELSNPPKILAENTEINISTYQFPIGTTTLTWRIIENGQAYEDFQDITVTDKEDPKITLGSDISDTTDNGQCTASIAVPNATFSDNCSGEELSWNMTGATSESGNGQVGTKTFNIGTTTLTYTVTDAANRTVIKSIDVTVTDNEDPTASNPEPISVQCKADIPEPDISVVKDEADNCTSGPQIEFVSDVSDGNFNPEVITRTYSITDEAGNSINVTQKITIDDTTAPTASNPEPISVQCKADVPEPDISVVKDEADNCTSGPQVEFISDVSDGNFNPEVITRTYSITDEAGNSINVIQEITIQDTQAPEILELSDLTGECPLTVTPPTTTDNCDGIVTATTGISDLTFEESGSVIWIFTDSSGNPTGAIEQKVIISDTTAPETAGILEPISIIGCQISSIEELNIPVAIDACENEINGTLGEDFQFPYSFYGTNTIQWQFTDSKGNVSFQEQEIELIEADIEGGHSKWFF